MARDSIDETDPEAALELERALELAAEVRLNGKVEQAIDIYEKLLGDKDLTADQRREVVDERRATVGERACLLAARHGRPGAELAGFKLSGFTVEEGGQEVSVAGNVTFLETPGRKITYSIHSEILVRDDDSALFADFSMMPDHEGVRWIEKQGLEVIGTEVRDPEAAEQLSEAVARAARDVEEHGWHMVAVRDDGGFANGFLYTVGLWRTFQHPEILLFAPQWDPQGMAGRLTAAVERIAAGEAFEAGKSYSGLFGRFPGAFRRVAPQHYVEHVGVTAGFYGSFDFPLLQLFWPDRESRFPWDEGFAHESLPDQPMLDVGPSGD